MHDTSKKFNHGGTRSLVASAKTTLLLLVMALALLSAHETSAAIAFRSASDGNNGTGSTSLTINKPSGVVSGDVMLAGISDTYGASVITAPAGWTLVRTLTDSYRVSIYRKTAGSSEPSDYTWTIADVRRAAGGIVALSGVDTTTPIQDEDGTVETGSGTSHATPSITTTGSSTWLVSIFSDRRDSGTFSTWTPPSGTTERVDAHSTNGSVSNVSVAINTVGPVSAGSKTHTATASGSSNKACMEIIALNAAVASTPTAPSGLTATATSNDQIDLSWTDNASDETGFKIERKTGAGGTYSQIDTTSANTTSYNSTGLTAGTTYYYRVRAYNGSGDSAYSNEANDTTTSSTITFRAATNANNGTGSTSLTINKPSGVVSGDVMLAGISDIYGQSAITAPSGWTLVRTLTDAFRTSIYRKTAGSSEPSDYTWTIADVRRAAGGIVAFSGVDTTTPIQDENGAGESGSGTSHATPSITTTGSSTWLVSIFADKRDSGTYSTWTPPSGTTERVDAHSTDGSQSNVSLAINTVGPVSAGSKTHTATASGSSDKACMQIIALNAAASGPPPSGGFDCLESGGTLNTSFKDLGTTTSAADLTAGGSTRYDFRGTVLNNSYDSGTNDYTPSYNVRFSADHDGGCMFGGTVKHGYAQSLGHYGSGTRNYPDNHGGQIFDKSTGGVFRDITNFTIDGWRMHHNWDPIRFNSGGSEDITLKQCWISDTYDDVIENDQHRDGYVIDDCLMERSYMFISCRNPNNSTNHGSRVTTVNNSLIGLGEMYPSDNRSVGMFFKLDGNSTKFDLYNCIFYTPRAGDLPNGNADPFYQLVNFGKLRNSSGNIIVWGGSGSYPFPVPSGFTVTTDTSVWTDAVDDWKTDHPHVPRISGFDP